MGKWFKRLLKILLGLFILVLIATIGIINFVNPNQFKDVIEQAVLKHTGQQLTIQGPLTWRSFPLLSLELDNVALKNSPPFQNPILTAKTVKIECTILPLLAGRLFLNITLKNVDLTLERNPKGQANWDSLKQSFSTSKNSTKSLKESRVLINSVNIDNGQITLNDSQKNNHYHLVHINLAVGSILHEAMGAIPIDLTFQIADNTAFPAFVDIKSTFQYQDKKLNIDSFKINLKNNGALEGNLKIERLEEPLNLKGNLSGKDLQIGKIKIDKIQADITAKNNIIDINPIHFQMIKSQQHASLKIDLREKNPKYVFTQKGQEFEMSDLLALFDIKNKLEGKTHVNLNLTTLGNTKPEWIKNLSGQANIEISNGKLHGINLINLLQTAQSSIEKLTEGVIHKLTTSLDSILNTETKKWKINPSSPEIFTPFQSVKATATITNGILKNPDLTIVHSEYTANGGGTMNLINNTLQYQASLALKNNPYPANDQLGNFLFNTPLLVTIQGNISDPSIRPDMKNYALNAIQFAQKQVIQNLIEKAMPKALQQLIPLP